MFSDTAQRIASPGLIPYDLNVAFWSDGAEKLRWIAIPAGKIGFSPTGEWRFPAGTVFVKNFDLSVDAANPAFKRRLGNAAAGARLEGRRVRRGLQMAA